MAGLQTFLFLVFITSYFQAEGKDKYTDENRPYEFGFSIEGEQHRHEKKDENGIIMGEFGFITADGVYHVTVYATDENGNFKILSMKNIRVKPYPSGATSSDARQGHSLTFPPAQAQLSSTAASSSTSKGPSPSFSQAQTQLSTLIPTTTIKATTESKVNLFAPAKSCSHCRLPTTTTTTPKPVYSQAGGVNNLQSGISSPNFGSPGPNDGTQGTYSPNSGFNQNLPSAGNLGSKSQTALGGTAPNYNSPTSQSALSQINNGNVPAYSGSKLPSSGSLGSNSQSGFGGTASNYNSPTSQSSLNQNNNGNVPSYGGSNLPISGNLGSSSQSGLGGTAPNYNSPNSQSPVSSINNVPAYGGSNLANAGNFGSSKGDITQNYNNRISQSALNQPSNSQGGPSTSLSSFGGNAPNYNSGTSNIGPNYNQNLNKQNNEQQSNIYSGAGNQQLANRGADSFSNNGGQDFNQNINQGSQYQGAERNPKQLIGKGQNDASVNSFGNQNLSKTDKPVLISAQMQIVDKNTDIYHKNPGEKDGLPNGLTTGDMQHLLYTFNYTLAFHGHYEEGYTSGAKQGYYFVTGRNGVRTRIDYVADEHGFRPKISQEVLDLLSEDVPKAETEKDEKYGLKGYEFKWLYYPVNS